MGEITSEQLNEQFRIHGFPRFIYARPVGWTPSNARRSSDKRASVELARRVRKEAPDA